MLPGRVSRFSYGDSRVPWLRKSSIVWIWQHYKRTDDYKIILNLCKKFYGEKSEKEAGKGPIKKVLLKDESNLGNPVHAPG